jgi:phage tail sheath gpL-like
MPISTAVPVGAVARGLGIKTSFKDLRGGVLYVPQRVAVVGQGASAVTYALTKAQVTSAYEAGETYGFGSPLHLAVLQLLPVNGDGIGTLPLTLYPLEDDSSGVAASGDITPSGAVTATTAYQVRVNNIASADFLVQSGDTVAGIVTAMTDAINANINMPVIATDNTTDVQIAAKWAGESSNGLLIEVVGTGESGVSFAITQPTGGLVNPEVDGALAQVGDVWETMFLNCMNIGDTDTLDEYQTFVEGRWGALTHKPCVVFTGNTEADRAAAVAISDSRRADYANSQLVAPGSADLPFVVAARQLARIALLANNNPPHDYGSQDADGLTPGADEDQWTYIDRNAAIEAGSSTIKVKDGVINIADVVTFYHPAGDPTPAYRYVVDIIKLQQVLYALKLIFDSKPWDGAPLVPDVNLISNPTAKKPRMAVAAVASVLDALALEAIISDPETAKASIVAEIDSQNPKRLNLSVTVQLAGNTNVISIDLNFGFYFGTAAAIAA